MSAVVGIASDPTALKLALTGIEVHEVRDVAEAQDIVDTLLDSEVQVLVVEEQFRDAFPDSFQDRLAAHRGLPLVVYCPLFDKENDETEAYVASVLKPAIGYEIRLE